MGDLGNLMAQAQQLQERLLAAQAEAAETVVEGQAGGGAVRVELSGDMEFRSVTIAPAAVDPDDVEMLQDLVLAALHDATAKVQELQQGVTDGLGLGGAGLGSGGGLGGLLG
jgi:DNA-binding YbaB/EbfC family protein